MFSDHWVISLLIGQTSALVLFVLTTPFIWQIMTKWDAQSPSDLQINLERKTYFISSALQTVMLVQITGLILFIFLINNHLPGLISGAMCGSGIIELNIWGYPVLFTKIIAVFLYAIFIYLNHLDHTEPEYHLTPVKYYIIAPALLIILFETYFMLQFFWGIEPDVIATCCSISFDYATGQAGQDTIYNQQFLLILFYLFSFGLLGIYIFYRRYVITLIVTFLFIPVALLALKHVFVRYIYALPSHNCLFDIFWLEYHYIGFILFGSLFTLQLCAIYLVVYNWARRYLTQKSEKHILKIKIWAISALLIFVTLNTIYLLYWKWIIL